VVYSLCTLGPATGRGREATLVLTFRLEFQNSLEGDGDLADDREVLTLFLVDNVSTLGCPLDR